MKRKEGTNMNETILQYLRDYPKFRERKEKAKWIGCIVLKKYGIELTPKLKDQMADLVTDMMNADRYWRMHTAEFPHLRGSDYDTKTIVEQQAMINLGYEPNYHNDTKHENIPQQ